MLAVIWLTAGSVVMTAKEQNVVILLELNNLEIQSFLLTSRERPCDVASVTCGIEFLICSATCSVTVAWFCQEHYLHGAFFCSCELVFHFQAHVLVWYLLSRDSRV